MNTQIIKKRVKRLNVSLLVQNIFNYIIYLARLDVPNSLILPLTVSLIAHEQVPNIYVDHIHLDHYLILLLLL